MSENQKEFVNVSTLWLLSMVNELSHRLALGVRELSEIEDIFDPEDRERPLYYAYEAGRECYRIVSVAKIDQGQVVTLSDYDDYNDGLYTARLWVSEHNDPYITIRFTNDSSSELVIWNDGTWWMRGIPEV